MIKTTSSSPSFGPPADLLATAEALFDRGLAGEAENTLEDLVLRDDDGHRQALTHFSCRLQEVPGCLWSRTQLSWLLAEDQRLPAASALLAPAAAGSVGHGLVHPLLVATRDRLAVGALDTAAELVTRAVRLNCASSMAWALWAQVQLRLGYPERAAYGLREVQRLRPGAPARRGEPRPLAPSQITLGQVAAWHARGEAPGAEQGLALLAAGQVEAAEKRLQHALCLQPGAVGARLAVARLYEERDRLDAALTVFQGVQAALPDSVALHVAVGRCQLRQGCAEAAAAAFGRALAAAPDEPEARAGQDMARRWLARVAPGSACSPAERRRVPRLCRRHDSSPLP